MKKLALVLIAASTMGTINLANAATRTANATASWDAKAIKDTSSMLVVTPLKSLTFNYAEGLERFNTQDGAFDITIAGQAGASDFKLTSKIISNTLNRTSDDSALTVGIKWNGNALSESTDMVMIDTSAGISAGLSALAIPSAYAGASRSSTQGVFVFDIAKATVAGTDTAFKDLTDGYWDGNVNVEFTATWDGTFTG
ncbi:common pilus major fimbrillin subunit EcpA [Serratia oryzae]|uniref:common pilus major fimbrillin subunit EcpA n=1 Tax=Serratia oryzae TaxID=2034155 RepID=UPI0012E1AB97|nr:common pilus major fimbrillin subunit EcpA [Serratia oryzae]